MAWEAVAAVGSLVGGVFSAVGQVDSGDNNKKAAEFNAATAESLARDTELQGVEQARRVRTNAYKILGDARSSYGASGVTTEGSPLDVLQESASNAELDALTVKHQTDLKAYAYRRDAQAYRIAGENSKTASTFGAAASLLGGAAGFASKL